MQSRITRSTIGWLVVGLTVAVLPTGSLCAAQSRVAPGALPADAKFALINLQRIVAESKLGRAGLERVKTLRDAQARTGLQNELLVDFQKRVMPIIDALRVERGLLAIFDIQSVVSASEGADLSMEVVRRLDLQTDALTAASTGTRDSAASRPTAATDIPATPAGDMTIVTKKPMPTPRMNAAAAVVGQKIYVLGGISQQGQAVASVEEYDTATDSWTSRAPMPTARGMLAAASIGGIIYAIGGRSASGGVLATVEAYDAKNNRWRSAPPLQQARWGVTAVEAGGKLLVLGGITGVGAARQSVTTVDVFDPSKNEWSSGKALPVTLQSAAAAEHDGDVIVAGGRIGAGDTGQASDGVYLWRPGANEWTKAPSLLEARTAAAAAVVGSKLVVLGGASSGTSSRGLEVLGLLQPTTWMRASLTLSAPRTAHVAVSVNGRIYVIGGATEASAAGITGLVEEITVK